MVTVSECSPGRGRVGWTSGIGHLNLVLATAVLATLAASCGGGAGVASPEAGSVIVAHEHTDAISHAPPQDASATPALRVQVIGSRPVGDDPLAALRDGLGDGVAADPFRGSGPTIDIAVAVSPGCDRAALDEAVESGRSSLVERYRAALVDAPAAAGVLVLALAPPRQPGGAPPAPEVLAADGLPPELVASLRSAVSEWRPHFEGQCAPRLTLVLSPPDEAAARDEAL